jgi:hypothetical protein
MPMVLQIVDGFGGALVQELNGWLGGVGGLTQRGLNLTEGQLEQQANDTLTWSPLAAPTPLGRRRITVPFVFIGSSADDVGAKVAKLMQATRSPWWLRVRRHGASQDSWLRCFPCVPQVESQVTASNVAHIARGVIVCETDPYALGARIDGSAAVGQDPSTAAWGIDINDVGGDTPTPLLLRMRDPSVFALTGGMGAFISVRRRQSPGNVTAPSITRQAEAGTNGVGANPGVSLAALTDSAFSGGAGRRATFSSTYAPLSSGQITFAAPTLSGVDVPGVYRMFVRIRRNTTALTQRLVLKPFVTGSLIVPEEITVPAGGAATRLIDLGLVQWPTAAPATISAPVPSASGATPTSVLLQFWRTDAGAAVVDFDFMCWIPADEDAGYLSTDGQLPVPASQWVVVDGYQHLGMVTNADPTGPHAIVGQSYASGVPTVDWTGGVPRVAPGSNRLFVVAGTSGGSYQIALNLAVAYSYWPRFTWLR